MRRLVLGVVIVVLGASCGWARPRFDAGNTGNNPVERLLSAANVGTLAKQFAVASATSSSAAKFVVAGGHVYVEGSALRVFDANGNEGCGGSPRTCSPQWSLDGPGVADVQGRAIYAPVVNQGARGYDAGGVTNCSGSPRICHSSWGEQLGPAVDGPTDPNAMHFVKLTTSAHGSESVSIVGYPIGCDGGSCVCVQFCTEKWIAGVGGGANGGAVGGPAVANGVVYASYSPVGGSATLSAFDGTNGVGAASLWSAAISGVTGSAIAVGDGVVVLPEYSAGGSRLDVFDAAGRMGCSGSPRVCLPLWTTDVIAARDDAAPAIANGVLYRAAGSQLRGYDLGQSHCTGSPRVCTQSWTAAVGPNVTAPAVANGLVFASASDGTVEAFDAQGVSNCSATTHVCSALWDTNIGAAAGMVAVADGRVFVAAGNGTVTAFGLP